MSEVRFLPPAQEEFFAAADWYDRKGPGLGEDFITEVGQIIERIAADPVQGSPYLVGTRRMLLRRFPFSVVYIIDAEINLIVAVAQHKRRPGYWRRRL